MDVGAVDMSFDLSGLSDVAAPFLWLMVDRDNDGSFADEHPITGAVDEGGGIYSFWGVDALQDDLRFTLAFARRIIITNRRITYRVNKN